MPESSERTPSDKQPYIWLKTRFERDGDSETEVKRYLSISIINEETLPEPDTIESICEEITDDLTALTTLRNWDAQASSVKELSIDLRTDMKYLSAAAEEIIKLRTQGTVLSGLKIEVDHTSTNLPSGNLVSSLLSVLKPFSGEDTRGSYSRIKKLSEGYTQLRKAEQGWKTFVEASNKPLRLTKVMPTTPLQVGHKGASDFDLGIVVTLLDCQGSDSEGNPVATSESGAETEDED